MKKDHVAGFLFRNNNTEVALIEKTKPAFQAGKHNGIGGKIDTEEERLYPIFALAREFYEEAGAYVPDWEQYCTLSGKNFCVHFFRSFSGDGIVLETKTEEEIKWMKVEDVLLDKIPILSNIKWLICMALDVTVDEASVIDAG